MLNLQFMYLLSYLYHSRSYLLEEKETLPFFGMEIEIFSFVKSHFFDFGLKLIDFN